MNDSRILWFADNFLCKSVAFLDQFRAGEALGLTMAREIFADRAYDDNGMLVARTEPGAMIEDPDFAAERIARFVRQGAIESVSGNTT